MSAFDRGVEFLTRKKIEERIATRSESLIIGSAKSYDDYKGQTGFIKGLKDALSLMEDARKETIEGDH